MAESSRQNILKRSGNDGRADACDFVITYEKFYKWMSDAGLQDGGIVTGDCSILFQTYASCHGRFLDLKAFTRVLSLLADRRNQAAQREAAGSPLRSPTRPSTAPGRSGRARDDPGFTPAAASIAGLTFRQLPSPFEIHEGEDWTSGVRKGITVYPTPRPPPPKVVKPKKRTGDASSTAATTPGNGPVTNAGSETIRSEPPAGADAATVSRRDSRMTHVPTGAATADLNLASPTRAASQRASLVASAETSSPTRVPPSLPFGTGPLPNGLSPRTAADGNNNETGTPSLKPGEMPSLLREVLKTPAGIPPPVAKVLAGVTALEKKARYEGALAALAGARATWRSWMEDHGGGASAGAGISCEGELYLMLLKAGLQVGMGDWAVLERTLDEAEVAAADLEDDAHEYHVVIGALQGTQHFHNEEYHSAYSHFSRAARLQRSSLLASLAAAQAESVSPDPSASLQGRKTEPAGVGILSGSLPADLALPSDANAKTAAGAKPRAASLSPSASGKAKLTRVPSMAAGGKSSGSPIVPARKKDNGAGSPETAGLSGPAPGGGVSTPRFATAGSFAEPDAMAASGVSSMAVAPVLPVEHGDVLLAVLDNNAGCCQHVMGDRRKAMALYLDAKVALVAKLGSGHPSTLTVIQNIALVRRMSSTPHSLTQQQGTLTSPRANDPANSTANTMAMNSTSNSYVMNNTDVLATMPAPVSPLLGASRPPAISSYYLKPVGTKGKMVLTVDQPEPPPVTKSKKKGEEVPVKKAPPTLFLYTPHYGTPAGGTFGPKKKAPASPPKKK
eukprot:jgi/Mesvir1/8776/Mv02688-RA.2